MKILGVLCSCRPGSVSGRYVKEMLRGAEQAGHETSLFKLNQNLHGCTGCHACKNGAEGCVQKDVLKPYFDALPDADVVILGAGIYMGYPQGEAWSFMNRHFCLHKTLRGECRIPAGKQLISVFAQGAPDNPGYRQNYEALLLPFDGWGFVRKPVIVLSGGLTDARLEEAFALGQSL